MPKHRPNLTEYKIRPKLRYVVTRYIPMPCAEAGAGSSVIAEVDTREQAESIVKAFTGESSSHSAWNILPKQDVQALLCNIAADEGRFTRRGMVVLIQNDGQVIAFGLGAKLGDPDAILDLGKGALKEPYP